MRQRGGGEEKKEELTTHPKDPISVTTIHTTPLGLVGNKSQDLRFLPCPAQCPSLVLRNRNRNEKEHQSTRGGRPRGHLLPNCVLADRVHRFKIVINSFLVFFLIFFFLSSERFVLFF